MPKPLILDSSVLIALTKKGELDIRLKRWKREGHDPTVPKAVAEEVVDEPKKLAEEIMEKSPSLAARIRASILCIEAAIKQGLITIEPVNYKRYSKVIDNARKHLSKLDALPEHAVKKGDPELVALAIQLCDETKEKVFFATLDKALLKTVRQFSSESEVEFIQTL